jgi:hypothetical protein
VRTLAATVAFGCLAWALVLHGRGTAAGPAPTDYGQLQHGQLQHSPR